MLVVITYDVNTETPEGKTRLRKVAKQCLNYGQRVQNSVFERILDYSKSLEVQNILTKIIDPKTDSLRFYFLGNKHKNKTKHIGAKKNLDLEAPLII